MIELEATILCDGDQNSERAFSLSKQMLLPVVPTVGASIHLDFGDCPPVIKVVEEVCFCENSTEIEIFLSSEFNSPRSDRDSAIDLYKEFGWVMDEITSDLIVDGTTPRSQ